MESKDTVRSYDELNQLCKDKVGEQTHIPNEKDRREVQAEISFKAGMEEVAEFIDGLVATSPGIPMWWEKWRAFEEKMKWVKH